MITYQRTPDPAGIELEQLADRLCTLAGRIAAATAEFLRLLGEFDERQGWAGPGLRSCAHWLSWRCGISLRTARDHVRVARRLRPLPVTTRTFAEGRLSYSKVRAICRVATPATEGQLVETSLCATASQVERMTRCIDQAAPEQAPFAPEQPHREAARLHWRWDDDGTLRVSGRLSAKDGAALLALLRATADARAETSTPTGESAQSQDAPSVRSALGGSASSTLLGEASRAGAQGLAAMTGADGRPAEVLVHVDADVLTRLRAETKRGLARAHLDGGPALSLATIERLACDGGIRLTTHGSDGRTLDLGRRRRHPTPRQVSTLMRRDIGCTLPGCGRRRFLHAHHVRFWSRGGRTDLDNLLLLCGEHHRALHDAAFTITGLGRQRFRFNAPDGNLIEYTPHIRGRCADVDETYRLIEGDSLTPNWHGEQLEPDLIIAAYMHTREAELAGQQPTEPGHDRWAGLPDPWAVAAAA